MQNDETERIVNEELQRLDSLVSIGWVPYAVMVPNKGWEGRYALFCKWPQADKRWEWVQQGKHDPAEARDILGWFCDDVHNANSTPRDPPTILRVLLELLYKCDNNRYPWAKRMAASAEKNRRITEKRKQDVMDLVQDEATHTYYHSEHAARSFGGLPDVPTKKEAEHGKSR